MKPHLRNMFNPLIFNSQAPAARFFSALQTSKFVHSSRINQLFSGVAREMLACGLDLDGADILAMIYVICHYRLSFKLQRNEVKVAFRGTLLTCLVKSQFLSPSDDTYPVLHPRTPPFVFYLSLCSRLVTSVLLVKIKYKSQFTNAIQNLCRQCKKNRISLF